MNVFFSPRQFLYDGSALRPLFLYEQFNLPAGDAGLAWIGPCNIPFEHMVDGEDRRAKAEIRGDEMVHFIFELFRVDLAAAVLLQRLLASLMKDVLTDEFRVKDIVRNGDDLYQSKNKLSISIATRAANSCLVHFAVNVTNSGTPVPTASLSDFCVDPEKFARRMLEVISAEWFTTLEATYKVFSR